MNWFGEPIRHVEAIAEGALLEHLATDREEDLKIGLPPIDSTVVTSRGARQVQLLVGALGHESLRLVQIVDTDQIRTELAEIRGQLTVDLLTRVANRRGLNEEAGRLFSDLRRHRRMLVIAMVDLDNFKRVNDRCGHAIGDHVLAFIADVIRNNLRAHDVVGRLGGDEFAILMPDTPLEVAAKVAERLLDNVAKALEDSPPARVLPTISIGLAEATPSDENFEGVLTRADHALYEAKAAGGDSVRVVTQGGIA